MNYKRTYINVFAHKTNHVAYLTYVWLASVFCKHWLYLIQLPKSTCLQNRNTKENAQVWQNSFDFVCLLFYLLFLAILLPMRYKRSYYLLILFFFRRCITMRSSFWNLKLEQTFDCHNAMKWKLTKIKSNWEKIAFILCLYIKWQATGDKYLIVCFVI